MPVHATKTAGLIPPTSLGTGTPNGSKYLRDDNVWATPTLSGLPLTDGDKGDITVATLGTVWTIDASAVTTTKMGGDVTTAGKSLLTGANAAAQRTTLGLGTAATSAATDFTAARTLVATLAENQATAANTTPVSLTGLVFTYAANSIYFFHWRGSVSPAAATTGCGFQLDVSSAVTQIAMSFYHQLANTGTLSGGSSIADDASVGVSSGTPAASAVPVIGDGILRTGASTGTAQLRFRSETTAVITALAGLTLVVEKVA